MADTSEGAVIPEAGTVRFLFRGQLLHAGSAIVLGAVAWALAAPVLGDGSWLGVADTTWFWASIGVAVVHQFYTWLAFRGQLGWGVLTRWFGRYDVAVHGAVFMPLLVAALFQHAFVWGHYLGTEEVDMEVIYG